MRLLITGASGLLGRALWKEFSDNSLFKVTGIAFSRSRPPLVRLDLTDHAKVSEFLRNLNPRFIIHAAAERRPDISEKNPQATDALNVHATENLAKIANELGAWMIFISTDYVFDGIQPPYRPDSPPNPLNYYGKSKLAGEKAVWKTTQDACVLRLPLLYGDVEFIEESAVTMLAELLKINKPVHVDHRAIRYPTLVDDVAIVIRQIIEYKLNDPNFSGTFHWSGDEPFTKYEMAKLIADIFGVRSDHLIADSNPSSGAPRPQNCHLDSSDLEKRGIGKRTPFLEGIKRVLEKYFQT